MAAPRRALAALAFLLAAGPALAEDAAPAAPTPYTNPEVGFSMEGPAGWRLESGAVAPPQWQSMAVFTEPGPGGAQIVVSVRKATATQLGRLRKEVSDFYAKDPSYRVNAITDLPVGGRRPLAGVLVDAVQTRPAEGTPGAGAAATANWRVQSAYFLGGEATLGRLEIAGRAAASVTAKGRVEGKDRVVLIGLVKRGGDLFRLEVTADEGQDAGAKAAFDAFAKKFVLLNP